MPEGASGDDIDANGDGEVLAVLDLGTDESLVEAGLAREVVNRVQKLRKKAGLVASDVVDIFLTAHQPSSGQSLFIVPFETIKDKIVQKLKFCLMFFCSIFDSIYAIAVLLSGLFRCDQQPTRWMLHSVVG